MHLKGWGSLVISSVLIDSTRDKTFKKMNVFAFWIRYFRWVDADGFTSVYYAKNGGGRGLISAGITKLCCTQSTVTFHIQQLEQELSVQLFEKIGRRMCLTSEGKRLMPHIHDLTRVMASIRQSAHQGAQPSGDLRVATGRNAAGV